MPRKVKFRDEVVAFRDDLSSFASVFVKNGIMQFIVGLVGEIYRLQGENAELWVRLGLACDELEAINSGEF